MNYLWPLILTRIAGPKVLGNSRRIQVRAPHRRLMGSLVRLIEPNQWGPSRAFSLAIFFFVSSKLEVPTVFLRIFQPSPVQWSIERIRPDTNYPMHLSPSLIRHPDLLAVTLPRVQRPPISASDLINGHFVDRRRIIAQRTMKSKTNTNSSRKELTKKR